MAALLAIYCMIIKIKHWKSHLTVFISTIYIWGHSILDCLSLLTWALQNDWLDWLLHITKIWKEFFSWFFAVIYRTVGEVTGKGRERGRNVTINGRGQSETPPQLWPWTQCQYPISPDCIRHMHERGPTSNISLPQMCACSKNFVWNRKGPHKTLAANVFFFIWSVLRLLRFSEKATIYNWILCFLNTFKNITNTGSR